MSVETAPPLLRALGVGKRFGAVTALESVDIEVYPGQITGLVGDNGAGKSTLIKIISGVHHADSGVVELEGRAVAFASAADARDAGIETVFQDLALAGNMSVWANIFLGREKTWGPGFLDKRGMAHSAQQMLQQLHMNVPPIDSPVAALSGGQRQAIAIARAAAWGSKIIIMDEPTAALGVGETAAVEELIRGLRDQGFGLLIISHNLDQVFRLADRITVLRRGRYVGDRMTADTTPDEIVAMITGAHASAGAR